MIERGLLIVFSGPSGVGKDTILREFMQNHNRSGAVLSVSVTTRRPRPDEKNGADYQFIAREQFEEMTRQGELLEWAEYAGNFYGTPKEPVERQLAAGRNVILEIELEGAAQVRKACPGAVFVFVMPPSIRVLRQRLAGRGTEDAAALERRMQTAITEISVADRYDYVIINQTVAESCEKLDAIIAAAGCAVEHMKDKIREACADA